MNLDVQMRIAANIRYLRNVFGYTQAEVSDGLHICRNTYALFETGKKVPGADVILDLAEFYHVHVSTVLQTSNDQIIADALYAKESSETLLSLMDAYYKLSPYSQGRLLERALIMLEQDGVVLPQNLRSFQTSIG